VQISVPDSSHAAGASPARPGPPPWGEDPGATIVGLAAAIAARSRGAPVELSHRSLAPAIAEARHLVLLLLDGFGERQLATLAPGGALAASRVGGLRSVFPTSTAPAITSFASAVFPAAHANPGWLCWSPQHAAAIRSLPMDVRGAPGQAVEAASLWDWRSASLDSRMPVIALQPQAIAESEFSTHAWAGAQRVGYRSADELVETIDSAVRSHPDGAWLWVYLPHFDSTSHERGWQSDAAVAVAVRFDRLFERLVARLGDSDALLLATADHGFIDVPPPQRLDLADFPTLSALLERPLCGEPRVAYCQPLPGAELAFEAAVRAQLGFAFESFRTAELIAAGWFGPGPVSPRLAARVGSHVLVGRDHYTLVDQVEGEKPPKFIGMHGGIHPDEIAVPLIAARRGAPLPSVA